MLSKLWRIYLASRTGLGNLSTKDLERHWRKKGDTKRTQRWEEALLGLRKVASPPGEEDREREYNYTKGEGCDGAKKSVEVYRRVDGESFVQRGDVYPDREELVQYLTEKK